MAEVRTAYSGAAARASTVVIVTVEGKRCASNGKQYPVRGNGNGVKEWAASSRHGWATVLLASFPDSANFNSKERLPTDCPFSFRVFVCR